MADPAPPDLNALRDDLARELRALIERAPGLLPDDEYKGILGRAESLLETQLPAIDALAELDLEAAGIDDHDRVVETLLRARHVPRMTVALGEVLKQEQGGDALAPVRVAAQRAFRGIDRLLRAWLQRQLDAVEPDEPDDGDARGEIV